MSMPIDKGQPLQGVAAAGVQQGASTAVDKQKLKQEFLEDLHAVVERHDLKEIPVSRYVKAGCTLIGIIYAIPAALYNTFKSSRRQANKLMDQIKELAPEGATKVPTTKELFKEARLAEKVRVAQETAAQYPTYKGPFRHESRVKNLFKNIEDLGTLPTTEGGKIKDGTGKIAQRFKEISEEIKKLKAGDEYDQKVASYLGGILEHYEHNVYADQPFSSLQIKDTMDHCMAFIQGPKTRGDNAARNLAYAQRELSRYQEEIYAPTKQA